ncbi:multiple epidermal growth factor-like domains protein 10 [Nematostella vectensis]|uniref:multiple epidermal growth factor-like domains protein 10 n=1 Tax=Nematostella vectensis TaxID=45351 RepID=UPI00207742D1|nr:multiple epidermal growth factor-like domains protein 10 [Nematostella vectensis]
MEKYCPKMCGLFKCPLKCQNGGKLDGETCTCTCKDGYKGADCADKLCSPGKYGWNCEKTCKNKMSDEGCKSKPGSKKCDDPTVYYLKCH